ncbi:MAG: pH regulation protein F [Thermomicrobiales bacterium]|nr:pH regulation protein F [Thermomicrobiales bacterium]
MHDFILTAAVVWTFLLMAIVVIGLLRTPHPLTRILMLDFITLILIAILILYAIREGRPFYLDAALVLAALSFISTTAAARYQAEGRPF